MDFLPCHCFCANCFILQRAVNSHICAARLKQERESLSCSLRILFQAHLSHSLLTCNVGEGQHVAAQHKLQVQADPRMSGSEFASRAVDRRSGIFGKWHAATLQCTALENIALHSSEMQGLLRLCSSVLQNYVNKACENGCNPHVVVLTLCRSEYCNGQKGWDPKTCKKRHFCEHTLAVNLHSIFATAPSFF